MHYFFSRRTFHAAVGRFTNNAASLTRYVGIDQVGTAASSGHMLEAEAWAQKVLQQSATGEVLVFVHGYNITQGESLKRLMKVKAGVVAQGFKGAVVGFDWPADGDLFGYQRDKADAKRVARFLVLDGIKLLQMAGAGVTVHLLAHSMGAYLAARGLGELWDADAPGAFRGKIGEALFVAADLDQAWLMDGAWVSLVMQRRAARLTHYYSQADQVLDMSGKSFNAFTLRSGQHGVRPGAGPHVVDVACRDRFAARFSQPAPTTAKTHNWYFDDSRFFADVVAVMAGTAPAAMQTRQPHGGGDQRLLP